MDGSLDHLLMNVILAYHDRAPVALHHVFRTYRYDKLLHITGIDLTVF